MSGEKNLSELLLGLSPKLNEGEYVFVSVQQLPDVSSADIVCLFQEEEGLTLIMTRHSADSASLNYDFIAHWITLQIHSSLQAVGLTAAVSTALAAHGISCNLVAGFYHDQLFVPESHSQLAMDVLRDLSEKANLELSIMKILIRPKSLFVCLFVLTSLSCVNKSSQKSEIDRESIQREVISTFDSYVQHVNESGLRGVEEYFSNDQRFYWVEDGRIQYSSHEALIQAIDEFLSHG